MIVKKIADQEPTKHFHIISFPQPDYTPVAYCNRKRGRLHPQESMTTKLYHLLA